MNQYLPALVVLAALSASGCQPATVTTPAAQPPEKDVHIRTPRVNVDVEHKDGSGKPKVEVDVKRNEK